MPALVAMQHKSNFRAKYHPPYQSGKLPRVIIAALMRKLIKLAYALIKAGWHLVTNRA